MTKTIDCVLLIDDDIATNFYNKRIVKRHREFREVVTVNSGTKALEYLTEAAQGKCKKPTLIFLDINMPGMNGWEFLLEYEKLNKNIIKDIKLIMLTTSTNEDDYAKSLNYNLVNDFINKPLSIDLLDDVLNKHYKPITLKKNHLKS